MRITRVSVHRVEIPFKPLGSRWIGQTAPSHLDSTVVALATDRGLTGHGESCPIGAIYLPAFAEGLRAGLEEIAPRLIGRDPTAIDAIYGTMNDALIGHPHVKAAVDIACWDLLGQACGLPVSALLGGRFAAALPAYASIPLGPPAEMAAVYGQKRSEGFRRFQIKIGDDPLEDAARVAAVTAGRGPDDLFMADANRGWSKADALRAVAALEGIDCYIEQPCASYEACRTVRARCRQPMILDEVIDDAPALARAIADDALDGLVIKLGHAGGLTPARLLRDLCRRSGLAMRIEDTAGSEIARAAQAQLAAATPPALLLGCYSFVNDMPPLAAGAPEVRDGALQLNDAPGLGIAPDQAALGDPVAVYG